MADTACSYRHWCAKCGGVSHKRFQCSTPFVTTVSSVNESTLYTQDKQCPLECVVKRVEFGIRRWKPKQSTWLSVGAQRDRLEVTAVDTMDNMTI